jgi:hypothetical protein
MKRNWGVLARIFIYRQENSTIRGLVSVLKGNLKYMPFVFVTIGDFPAIKFTNILH